MDNSGVHFSSHGAVTHTGDAVRLYQAKVIRKGLKACKLGMRLNRQYTPANLLRTTTSFTGQTYKRGQLDAAILDLTKWIEAAEASMPVTYGE